MGGVELLSREGEIAIAKRIEAGKDVMLIALSQSPITAQQFLNGMKTSKRRNFSERNYWYRYKLYGRWINWPKRKTKKFGETDKDESTNENDDEEFNPTLAAMESEIKPKVLKTVNTLARIQPLIKYQKEN